VSFSESSVQPQDTVSLTVTAYKNSYVGLSAVDQSVLLLKSGNDITQDLVRIADLETAL
jgi:CD109 antigen